MNVGEVEELARDVRTQARVSDADLVNAAVIAERIMGAPVMVARGMKATACLSTVNGRARIFLRRIGPDVNFDIAHELGHYVLRQIANYSGPVEERLANQFAAALLAPPALVREAHRIHGALKAIRPLAKAAMLSQTAAQLRLGEVIGDERAVVTKTGNVLVRSQGAFPWAAVSVAGATPEELRALGLAKAALRGGIDTGRVALRARR